MQIDKSLLMVLDSLYVVTYFIHNITVVYSIHCVFYATISVMSRVQFYCKFLELLLFEQPVSF